jgi:hypothetical protein
MRISVECFRRQVPHIQHWELLAGQFFLRTHGLIPQLIKTFIKNTAHGCVWTTDPRRRLYKGRAPKEIFCDAGLCDSGNGRAPSCVDPVEAIPFERCFQMFSE